MRSTLCQSFERIVNPGDGRVLIALEQVSTLPCTKTLLHTAPTAVGKFLLSNHSQQIVIIQSSSISFLGKAAVDGFLLSEKINR